jgi:hypothetical protein
MTTSQVELTIAELLAGKEKYYEGIFFAAHTGGDSRTITHYGFDSEKQSFYTYYQEEHIALCITSPSEREYITEEELKLRLSKELYY